MADAAPPKTPTTPRSIRAKLGRPRAPVPISIWPSDPLWDEARNLDVADSRQSGLPSNELNTSTSAQSGGQPADGTTASSSMAPPLPTAGQQSGLSHPATATVPGRAGSRVQNLLARMQTQVTSRSVQRTVVDLNVHGRVQQVAANHGGVRSSTYLASGSTSPERTATGAGLMSSLPSWLVPSSVDQDSSVRERSCSPASSGSGSARPSLLPVPTTSPAPLPEPIASSPPPRPSLELDMSIVNRPLSVEAQPALPDQDSFRQASSRINAFAPTSAVDASTSTTPRRRMRADHLARCINLQHGMLRESRIGGSDGNDDLLTRLSMYEESAASTFSPGGLLRAAEALDARLAMARSLGALTEGEESPGQLGPMTAPVFATGRRGHLRAASDLPSLRVPPPTRRVIAEQGFAPIAVSRSSTLPTAAPASAPSYSAIEPGLTQPADERFAESPKQDLGVFSQVPSPVEEKSIVSVEVSRDVRTASPRPQTLATTADGLFEQDVKDEQLTNRELMPSPPPSTTQLSYLSDAAGVVVEGRSSPNPIDSGAPSTPVPLAAELHPVQYNSQLRVSPVRHFDGPISASADSDVVDVTSPAIVTNRRHDLAPLSPIGSDTGIGLDVEVPFTFDGDLRTARASAVPSSAGFRASFLPDSSAPVDHQLEEEFAALTARSTARGASNSPSSSPSLSIEDLGEELPHELTDMPYTFPDADTAAKARRVSAVPSSAGFRNSFFFHGVPTSTELEDEYAALRDAWHHGDSDDDAGREQSLDLVDEPSSSFSPALELADAQIALSPRSMRSGRSSSTESRELERLRQSAYEAEFSYSPGPTPVSASMSYHTSRPSSYMPTTAGFSEFSATPNSIAFSDVERTLDEVAPARLPNAVQPNATVQAPAVVESSFSPTAPQQAFSALTSAGSRLTFSPAAVDAEHVFALSPSLGSGLDSGEHSAWPYSPTTSSWAHGTDMAAISLDAPPPVPDVCSGGADLAADGDTTAFCVDEEQTSPAYHRSTSASEYADETELPLSALEANVPRVVPPSSTSSPSSVSPVFEPPFTATSYSLSPYVTEESFDPLGTSSSEKLMVDGSRPPSGFSQIRQSEQNFLDAYHTEASQRGSQLVGAPWTGVGYSLSPYLRTPAPGDSADDDDSRVMARDESEALPSAYFRSPGPNDSSQISAGDRLVHQPNEAIVHRHDDEALPSPYMHSPTGGQTFGAASGLATTSPASASSRLTPAPPSSIQVNVDVAQHEAPMEEWSVSHRPPSTSLAPPLSPNSISFPTARSRPESGSSLQLLSRPPSGSPLASPAPSTSFSHETAQIGLAVLVSVAPPLPTTFSALNEIFGRYEAPQRSAYEQSTVSPDDRSKSAQRLDAEESQLAIPRPSHTKAGSMERLHRSKASIDLLIRTPRREPDVPHTPLPPTPLPPSQATSDGFSEESATPPPPPPKTQSVLRMAQRIQEAKQVLQDEEPSQIAHASLSSSTSASNSLHRSVMSNAHSGQAHQNETLREAEALRSDPINLSPTTNAIYVPAAPLGSPGNVPSPTSSLSSLRSARANTMSHGESPVHIQTFTASATVGTSASARPRAKTTTGPIRAFHRPTPLPRSKSNSPLVPGVQVVQDSASPPPPPSLQPHHRVPQSVKFSNPWPGREQSRMLQPWQASATQFHQRNASLQPVSPVTSSAGPSAVRGFASSYAPRHSQSEQSLRTRALLGALGSPFASPHASLVASSSSANKLMTSPTSPSEGSQASASSITPPAGKTSLFIPPQPVLPAFAIAQVGSSRSVANTVPQTASSPVNEGPATAYLDTEDEDDALDQLKREMMEWQIGVASAWSDGPNKPVSIERRTKGESLRLAPDTPMKFVFEHREQREQKSSAKDDMPSNSGGYMSSSSSNAGSVKPHRPLEAEVSSHHHGSNRQQANGASKGSRRNSFERLYSALYAAPAAPAPRNHIRTASADTRPSIDEVVTRPRATTTADDRYRQARPSIDELMSGHARTASVMSGMSGMSSMSTASSFFSSDLAEMGRSRSANAIVTRPPPAGPRIPLKHAASLDSSVVKGHRPEPSESIAVQERFASADGFAAHVARFGSTGSDSTHVTASSGSMRQTALQHSTFIAYATVNSVESANSSVPSTPADSAVDWEHAFGIRRQQSRELLGQTSTTHAVRDAARDGPNADENARNSSRWSEDSTHRAAMLPSLSPATASAAAPPAATAAPKRDRSVLTKQPSRTNLNASSPSLVQVPRSGSVTNLHSMYETASPSPSAEQAPWSAAGGTFGGAIARRLRLKSLPGKPSKVPVAPSAFTFGKLVGKKTSTEELRSGWIG